MLNRHPGTALALTAFVLLFAASCARRSEGTAEPAAPAAAAPASAAAASSKPPIGLSGGAPSIDALLDQFLAALEQKDTQALERLRLTKEEYTQIVMPGTVTKGQPPLQTFEKANDVAWGLLNARSHYTLEAMISGYGGRHYVKRQLEFSESPPREYAWYIAYGGTRLTLWDEQGEAHELSTGWIADVDGSHKFIGFNRSD